MKKRIGIQGTLTVLGVIVGIALSRFVLARWSNFLFDLFVDACGLFLILYGFGLRIIARGYKEEESLAGNKLVKGGPYAIIRNPMYLGTFLIAGGAIITVFQLWVFLVFLVIYLAIYLPEMKKEEKILTERFGEEYRQYCHVTPKYFPRVFNLLNFKVLQFSPLDKGGLKGGLKKSWFKKELPALIAVLVIVLAIEAWQDIELFGGSVFLRELVILFVLIFVLQWCLRYGIINRKVCTKA